jgi:hypothetical protein
MGGLRFTRRAECGQCLRGKCASLVLSSEVIARAFDAGLAGLPGRRSFHVSLVEVSKGPGAGVGVVLEVVVLVVGDVVADAPRRVGRRRAGHREQGVLTARVPLRALTAINGIRRVEREGIVLHRHVLGPPLAQ